MSAPAADPSGRPRRQLGLPRMDGLVRLRLQFWGMVAAVGLGVALMWRLRDTGTLDGLDGGLAVAIGVVWAMASLAAVVVLRKRNLKADSPRAAAQAYNVDFVLKATVSMSNMVAAFGLLLASGSFAPAVALSLSALAGLLLTAPVDADLNRREKSLRESVPALDLRDALRRFRPGELPAETPDRS